MTMIILNTEERRRVFQAIQLKHALALYEKCGMLVTRGATPRRLLDAASLTTGKRYTNSLKGRAQCINDLIQYLDGKSLHDPVEATGRAN